MKFQHFFILASCAALLSACSQNKFAGTSNPSYPTQANCQGNHYLERYGCSLERLTAAARNGDADAQYGLGYMYYYGIGTMRDETTARAWIKRSAAQGQPLAIKAYAMMTGQAMPGAIQKPTTISNSLPSGTARPKHPKPSLHQAAEDVGALNTKKANASVTEQLPGYGKNKKSSAVDSSKKANQPINSSQNESDSQMAQMVQKLSGAKVNPAKMTPTQQVLAPKTAEASPGTYANKKLASNEPQKPVQKEEGIGRAAIPNQLSSAERWMMQHPAKHYSLQIMGGRDVKAIQNFIAQNHLQGKAHYYSAELQGQKWYMLVYGDFSSAKQAFKASKKLPQDLRSHHPWIKSYAEIQKEIKDREIIS